MLGNLTGRPPYPGRVCHGLRSRHPPSQEPLRAHRPVDPCASGSACSGHGRGGREWEPGGRVHTTPQRSPLGPLRPAPPGAPSPGTSAPCSSPGQACSPAIPGPEKAPGTHGFPFRTSAVGRGGEAGSRGGHRGAQMCFQRSWETGLLVRPGARWVGGQVEAAGGAGGAAGARRRRTCQHITLAGRLGQGGAEQVCQRGAL